MNVHRKSEYKPKTDGRIIVTCTEVQAEVELWSSRTCCHWGLSNARSWADRHFYEQFSHMENSENCNYLRMAKKSHFQLLLPDKQELILWNRTSLFSVVPLGRGRPMTTFKVTHWSELFSCIRRTAAWSEDLCIPRCQIHKWILLTVKSYFTQTFSYVTISVFSTEHWTQIFQNSSLRWPSNFQKSNTPLPHRKKDFRIYFWCLCLMIQGALLQQCLKNYTAPILQTKYLKVVPLTWI